MSRIRTAREKAQITQTDLAKRLKVSVHIVRKWENGTRSPRTQRLKALARALKCDVVDIL